MQHLINGIIQQPDGYAIKNFLQPSMPLIQIGRLSFPNYRTAVVYLANLLYPQSYKPYLLAVEGLQPTEDTWNNLIYTGHALGIYDHEQQSFLSARSQDMQAASDVELAYVDALQETYTSILSMIRS